MPPETMLAIAGITLVFVTFAIVMLWADRRTRGLSQ